MYHVEEEFEHNGLRVRIIQDEDPLDPEEGDVPVYLVHFHRQLERCPDELPFSNEAGLREWMTMPDREDYSDDEEGFEEYKDDCKAWQDEHDEWVVFPVSAHIHSGIALSVGHGVGWDTSNCGFVFIRRDGWGSEVTDEGYSYTRDGETTLVTWRELAKNHVKVWNQYLSGEVYGYIVDRPVTCKECEHTEYEDVDSCWGFYGVEVCKEEAISAAG